MTVLDAGDCHHRDRLYQQHPPLPYQHVVNPSFPFFTLPSRTICIPWLSELVFHWLYTYFNSYHVSYNSNIDFCSAGASSRATWPVCLWPGETETSTEGHTLHLPCQEIPSQVIIIITTTTTAHCTHLWWVLKSITIIKLHVTFFRSKRIDIVARIIFPIVFATFNLCYWTFYLSEEHKSLRQATKWS